MAGRNRILTSVVVQAAMDLFSDSSSSSDSEGVKLFFMDDIEELEEINFHEDIDLFFEKSMEELLQPERYVRIQKYIDTVRKMPDKQFREFYRLKRSVANYLIDQLKDVLNTDRYYYGRKPISAELSLYIYLEFIGNTEPLRKVSHLFDVTISSVFRVTRRVTSWLHSLMDDIIRWPNGEEVRANERFFRGCSGINKIVASIDGTQVRTIKPRENHQSYFNRKKSYSVNLQAEVDAKRRFISVYAGEPGSQHDARVFRRSPLYRLSNVERERYFPDDSFLVGDSAYPSTSYLVTPFRDNGRLTADQIDFNEKISKARVIVENAFAMLKGRFRRLKFFTEFLRIEFLTDLIIAACILHNICVDSDDDGNDFFEVDEELGNDEEMIENDMNGRPQVDPNINLEQEHDRRRDELFRSMYP